jgi:dolichyl-phosphate beta-glucosyltransferase
MGRVFNLLIRLAVLGGISDTQCGFKGLRAAAAEDLFSRLTIEGFGFDVELLLLARRAGLHVVQIPVDWHNSPLSRVHPLKDSARMLGELWAIRRRYRKGRGSGSGSP